MDSPLNAFGIFSMERDMGGKPLDFAADGYRSEMGCFLRQGPTYIQIIASTTEDAVMTPALEAARALAGELPADDTGLEARMQLPADGQVPGSLSYVAQNAYGQEALSHVFEAAYLSGGAELRYFVTVADSPEQATAMWGKLRKFFSKYGEMHESFEAGGGRLFLAESYDQFSVIAVVGSRVCGVMNAEDRKAARHFVVSVLEGGGVPDPGNPAPAAVDSQPPRPDYGHE